MSILYNEMKKDLPAEQLHALFMAVGWSDGSENAEMMEHFNLPFIHSTLVVSAWEGARVLSDQMFRSVLYDLVVLPEYQGMGIGRELLTRCMAHFPRSEWLVQTTAEIANYYEQNGFTVSHDVFLTVSCAFFHTIRKR